jgi:hypothetical protein
VFNLHLNVLSLGYKYKQRELSNLEIPSRDLGIQNCERGRLLLGEVGL